MFFDTIWYNLIQSDTIWYNLIQSIIKLAFAIYKKISDSEIKADILQTFKNLWFVRAKYFALLECLEAWDPRAGLGIYNQSDTKQDIYDCWQNNIINLDKQGQQTILSNFLLLQFVVYFKFHVKCMICLNKLK